MIVWTLAEIVDGSGIVTDHGFARFCAEHMGLSARTIENVLRGKHDLSSHSLVKIAEAMEGWAPAGLSELAATSWREQGTKGDFRQRVKALDHDGMLSALLGHFAPMHTLAGQIRGLAGRSAAEFEPEAIRLVTESDLPAYRLGVAASLLGRPQAPNAVYHALVLLSVDCLTYFLAAISWCLWLRWANETDRTKPDAFPFLKAVMPADPGDETHPIPSFWETLRNWYAANSWRELARMAGDEERYARELRRWRGGQHAADFRTMSEMIDCLNEQHTGQPLDPTGSYACYLMARMLGWFGSQRQVGEALACCSTAGIDLMSGSEHPGRSPFPFIASRCRRWNELVRDQVAAGEFWEAGSAGN